MLMELVSATPASHQSQALAGGMWRTRCWAGSARGIRSGRPRPSARIQLKPDNLEVAFAQAPTTHYTDPAK